MNESCHIQEGSPISAPIVDVQVVGGGFSGLMSALFAAQRGYRVRLLQRGNGTLGLSGGTIDVLAYNPQNGAYVEKPLHALQTLPATHPYSLVGINAIHAALKAFIQLTTESGYAYVCNGELHDPQNTRLLTVIGTAKASCLVPPSMSMTHIHEAKTLLVLGFEGLKDVFPQLTAEGFSRRTRLQGKHIIPITTPCPTELAPLAQCADVRDLSLLDVARFTDTHEGTEALIALLRNVLKEYLGDPDTVLLLPPVLGSKADVTVHEALEGALGLPVYEMLTPPPGTCGLRLRRLLLAQLHHFGVEIVHNATVTAAETTETSGKECKALISQASGQLRCWPAKAHIIATGGIYGEGLCVEPTRVYDRIFETAALTAGVLPVDAAWSAEEAFPAVGHLGHAFANLGLRVDEAMRPLNTAGHCLCSNVHYVGRALGGYDMAREKSGNGVALVTAWKAVESLHTRFEEMSLQAVQEKE